jgi:hypothetical protein
MSLDDAQLGYDSALCDKINEAVFHGQGSAHQRMDAGESARNGGAGLGRARGRC